MPDSEFSAYNYKRISLINGFLIIPMTVLFGWPFLYLCDTMGVGSVYAFPGALLFSLPFMFTILHGHVTMALGAAHRHHYYRWLRDDHPYSYGLLFHEFFVKTRFRLLLLGGSAALFSWGWLAH